MASLSKKMTFIVIAILMITIFHYQPAIAVPFNDIEFPLGSPSFADRVEFYSEGGGLEEPFEPPENALGIPDDINVSIGNGGILIVEFTDNLLVDQDTVEGGLDLFIFESGSAVEDMEIAISKDGINFIELGKVTGQPSGIDIAPFISSGDAFRFVRIIDVVSDTNQTGPFAGADIDAVGAIGSIAVVPAPTSILLLISGLIGLTGLRRKFSKK